MGLSLVLGVVLAVMAKGVAVAFNVSPTMSMVDFIVVSSVGGLLASGVVLAITLALSAGSVRFGWDLDNVVAPLVTATADLVALPALVVGAELAGYDVVTPVVAAAFVVVALGCLVWSLRSPLGSLRGIVRESIPVLVIAGLLDLLAGITVEKRLDDFVSVPVLLVLLPGFLGTAGALGGILSSRLSTKLHLGLVRPSRLPSGPARSDLVMTFLLSVPIFAVLGAVAEIWGRPHRTRQPRPGRHRCRGASRRRPRNDLGRRGRLLRHHRRCSLRPRSRHVRDSYGHFDA